MNCIVTGGAGFIGSHLCEYLLHEKHQVFCIDNLITGSRKNIEHLIDNSNFTFINQDIIQDFSFKEELDMVFHFASPASPVDYYKYPIDTLRVGSIGTENMLRIALKKKARFMLASTSEVYGDPKIHPQKESYWGNVNSIGPRSVYDEAKRYAEAVTMAYHREYRLDVRIARIFNTYGPRMKPDDGRAVPNFIKQSLRDEPITIYGDGSQTRSFCFVSDEVDGLFSLMNSNYEYPVNIGNPEEYSILELASIVKEICKSSSEFTYKELPVDDPKCRRPDISKAKEILDWQPKIDIREGLKKTIKWFKKTHMWK
jgi:dTDP-glucose 4,6-dehydratase